MPASILAIQRDFWEEKSYREKKIFLRKVEGELVIFLSFLPGGTTEAVESLIKLPFPTIGDI